MTPKPRAEDNWVHDWNRPDERAPGVAPERVVLNDETLRDGIQSPSVTIPKCEEKVLFLHILVGLGIQCVDIGLPAAGESCAEDTLALAREIAREKLPVCPNCAARTLACDIDPVIEISQRAGIPIEAATFLGSSPIRQAAEGWDLDFLLRATESAVRRVVAAGLPSMFVTEDTTRAHPKVLEALYTAALGAGARRICIADTAGFATPSGASRIVGFLRGVIARTGISGIGIDWHGHQDRGLGVACSLAAFEAGADRIHGAGLGLGERVGNTPLDQLVINFKLMGLWDRDVSGLQGYVDWVAAHTGVEIPPNYPVFGRNAFRTGTGIHAAAIYKAALKGDRALAERVYSSVPASWFGMEQVVEVGPMSGESNVLYWLWAHGEPAPPDLVKTILRRAKASPHTLPEEEIRSIIRDFGTGGQPDPRAPLP